MFKILSKEMEIHGHKVSFNSKLEIVSLALNNTLNKAIQSSFLGSQVISFHEYQ